MRICHFIPSDGIGGVETAAKTASIAAPDVKIVFVSNAGPRTSKGHGLLGRLLSSFRGVLNFGALREPAALSADVAVFSLWKTTFLMLAWKARSKRPAVLFLHCDRADHWLDAMFARIAIKLADGILTDSEATALARLTPRERRAKPTRTVSMLAGRLSPPSTPVERVAGRFVFWGRVTRQKRVDKALKLFAALKKHRPEVRFDIIGPDGGELRYCRSIVDACGLSGSVRFLGAMPREAIANTTADATFFVHLSDFEGFGMSVAEAMQLGLIPVVTAVGEVARYCIHMENALVMRNEEKLVAELIRLLDEAGERRRLSRAAIQTWAQVPEYAEDFPVKIAEICRAIRR